MGEFLTVPEFAAAVKQSPWTIWRKLTKGKIKRVHFGGRTLIRRSEIDRAYSTW